MVLRPPACVAFARGVCKWRGAAAGVRRATTAASGMKNVTFPPTPGDRISFRRRRRNLTGVADQALRAPLRLQAFRQWAVEDNFWLLLMSPGLVRVMGIRTFVTDVVAVNDRHAER